MSVKVRAVIAGTLIGVLASGAALGQQKPEPRAAIERAFGNTIVSTTASGGTTLLWLHPNGAYTAAKGRKRKPSSGSWRLQGDRVCLKQAKPTPIPISYCTAMPKGETWAAKSPSGKPLTVRLVRGVNVR